MDAVLVYACRQPTAGDGASAFSQRGFTFVVELSCRPASLAGTRGRLTD